MNEVIVESALSTRGGKALYKWQPFYVYTRALGINPPPPSPAPHHHHLCHIPASSNYTKGSLTEGHKAHQTVDVKLIDSKWANDQSSFDICFKIFLFFYLILKATMHSLNDVISAEWRWSNAKMKTTMMMSMIMKCTCRCLIHSFQLPILIDILR